MLACTSAEHDDGPSHDISGVRMNKHDDEQLEREVNTLEIGNEAHSRWPAKFLKSHLEFGFNMAQVNFAGSEQDGFGPPVTPRSRLPLWSRAAEIYFYYCIAKAIVSSFMQYNYERANEEFKMALNSSSTGENTSSSSSWFLLQEKKSQLARAIELAEMIGNPFYEVGAPVYILVILFVNAGIHFYLEIRIYNYLRGPIVVGVARLFLNPRLERKLMVRDELQPLIDNVVQSAANSLSVYKCNLVRSQLKQASQKGLATLLPEHAIANSLQKRLSQLRLSQEQNVIILRNMLASGQLDPPNRRPEWIRSLAMIYGSLVPIWTACGYLMAVFFFIWVPCSGWLNDDDVKLHYGPNGILFTLETLVLSALYTQWVIFPAVLIPMNTLDHIVFAMELKRMVVQLAADIVALSELTNNQLTTSVSLNRSSVANKQLVRVLIQYRLFKQQLFSIQPVLGFISFNAISAMLLPPALLRIYAAHLSAGTRQVFMIYCLFIICMIDILVMPTCYLYARCLELYRALSYLLARLDRAVSQHQCNQVTCDFSKGIHLDRHTLSLLRRELQMPEFVTQQFATNAHFMRLTYSNLMAANFYCGLWLVPMLMRNTLGLTSGTSALLDILA